MPTSKTDTPIWIKAVGGLGLGFGKTPFSSPPVSSIYSVVNGPIAFETSLAPWEIDMI
jgi:hypothetical protein